MPSHHHFNTSNVTIQLYTKYATQSVCPNFNTSNVTIQPYRVVPIKLILMHFNTSNVTIQQKGIAKK